MCDLTLSFFLDDDVVRVERVKARVLFLYCNYSMSEQQKLQILGLVSGQIRQTLNDFSKNVGVEDILQFLETRALDRASENFDDFLNNCDIAPPGGCKQFFDELLSDATQEVRGRVGESPGSRLSLLLDIVQCCCRKVRLIPDAMFRTALGLAKAGVGG